MPQGKGNREHCLGNTVTGRINPVSDHASRFNYWFPFVGRIKGAKYHFDLQYLTWVFS